MTLDTITVSEIFTAKQTVPMRAYRRTNLSPFFSSRKFRRYLWSLSGNECAHFSGVPGFYLPENIKFISKKTGCKSH